MLQELKQKIRQELHNPNFPNLAFLYSEEVLRVAPEFLKELLEEEKKDFEEKIAKRYKGLDTMSLSVKGEDSEFYELSFDTFEDFSELDYFFSLLEHYQGVHNDEIIRQIIEDFEPLYIDFGNEVAYNKRLYEMYTYFYEHILQPLSFSKGEDSGEDSENICAQKRIIEKTLKAYEVRGIALPEEKQDRLKEISKELSELSQKFSNNILDDRKNFEYIITDETSISEMPEDDKSVAQKKAEEKWKKWFLFDASAASHAAIMKYCSDANIRKHFYEARIQFASSGKYDNRQNILTMLKLREEKAHILGYKNYAELSLVFKMAETPEQVKTLFGDISKKARPKAQAELEEIKNYFNLENLDAWDSSYYSRKLREQKYEFDEKELKKYFVFENVRAALFETVKRLYNLELQKKDVELYTSEAEFYEVYKDGNFVSYFYTDYFYTPLKRQGAWADIQREAYNPPLNSPPHMGDVVALIPPLDRGRWGRGFKKIVVNVCNFQKNTQGKTLLTLDEVETMYHEFGHAIHEMLSFSPYSELSGFHVEWDFVELPSQLLENWCRHPDGMKLFARHCDTGENIPDEMLQKLQKLETFGNGNFILKQNEFAMLDMTLHSEIVPESIEVLQQVSDRIYRENSLFPLSNLYKHYASFSHIFDGGYAAGYYSYMWAEIIEKEVWKAFLDSWNIFSPEVAHKFYTTILWAGTTKKASELFRDFLWRDPQIDAFLQEKGLV